MKVYWRIYVRIKVIISKFIITKVIISKVIISKVIKSKVFTSIVIVSLVSFYLAPTHPPNFYNRTEVAWNKSSLLLNFSMYTTQELQLLTTMYNEKIFTKDNNNAKQRGLGLVDQESTK